MSTPTISPAPRPTFGAKSGAKPRSGQHVPAAARRGRQHIVAPSLRIGDGAAAAVFAAARLRGPIARDVIAQVTSLSIATVNRQVTAYMNQVLGKDAEAKERLERVVIPKCKGFTAD